MKKIIYYVATSLDGYIAGPNDEISDFILEGEGVKKYQSDLSSFKTVIMGRKTYEFGYQYGLVPGKPAYPNMEHYIFSDSMKIENLSDEVHIEKPSIDRIKEIKSNSESDIYLCGGGKFAGWLLENDLIDQLIIKLNPITLGDGIKLFGETKFRHKWKLNNIESFDKGMQIITYDK